MMKFTSQTTREFTRITKFVWKWLEAIKPRKKKGPQNANNRRKQQEGDVLSSIHCNDCFNRHYVKHVRVCFTASNEKALESHQQYLAQMEKNRKVEQENQLREIEDRAKESQERIAEIRKIDKHLRVLEVELASK